MLLMRTFRSCYLCHCSKMITSKNMSVAVNELNVVPEHLCNLAKQLNVKSSILSKVINNHQEKLKFYSESRWLVLFEYLTQYDFKTSELLEMIDSNPDILSINRQNLQRCMIAWTNFRFEDKKLRQLIISQPSCLLLDDKLILSRIPKLLSYVGNKQNRLLELISYSPNILFDNWKYIESKLDYILLNMELGPTQFVTTSVLSSTLFDLKCRHTFLVKLGMYKPRDPKASPNLITGNPSLKAIIETSDKQFAVKVAGVTAEEFFVYKKIFKKQLDEENDDDSDECEYYSDDN
ncbi:transcription termination factor 4, mitochondrial [Metopolophium dirhodum]|uniref:transcription termination factor 4, mitochondrial n=1 Tax=Metopolophium dirhodum TaxID=44670 RepID=UPI00298F8D7C|nr:transcription termination factor 4, mitochondrial [Metopolophium dirhodum]XP_060876519.1 transcription termination factor 4, mitochondrial [Metopolophium dirhodum]XP_060876520.1 transcription termination factor 4, mitochondrial [Metopolophium dirhodum]XP_060876521.1 transcription termination factor 4, mitochondrial [Metopolophium dirhodum]